MNKRIKELRIQACKWASENVPITEYENASDEKFAELIVAHATECVRDVLRDEKSDLSYAAASQVQDRIKEHFGVE
jgi:hypothetical protein